MDVFDYSKFVVNSFDYLVQEYGMDIACEQRDNSDLEYEVPIAKNFLANYKYTLQIPVIEDIKDLLVKGYLVGCNVNSCSLNGKEGYSGHFVIVIGFDQNSWIIQDPGGLQGGFANRCVSYDLFQTCWAYPNDRACNLLAIKK